MQLWSILMYAVTLAVMFHLVVVLVEEPHLLEKHGESYRQYLRSTPRWFSIRRSR
jgi:protein-S-isoprenylcysteine O-methyltransferase Ste14